MENKAKLILSWVWAGALAKLGKNDVNKIKKDILEKVNKMVLIHLSKGQLSKDHFVQGTLVQEDFCPRRHWSKETIVQGESLKH